MMTAMAWTMYKVMLRLRTPLHVGMGQMGNVQRSRSYVIGKTLWGALTARITRDLHPGASGADYRQVGEKVNEQLAFSYFYPAVGESVDVWPWGDTAAEFSWRYLNTYASTALNYDHYSAEDGSLHEVEFIAPVTRDGDPVNLVGYIFERAGCDLKWRKALPCLQLGGERGYGWGRVECLSVDRDSGPLFGQWQAEDGDRPMLVAQDDAPRLLAHTIACGSNALTGADGPIEPLVGRETRAANRHGEQPVFTHVCWTPGAFVHAGEKASIAQNGLWQSA